MRAWIQLSRGHSRASAVAASSQLTGGAAASCSQPPGSTPMAAPRQATAASSWRRWRRVRSPLRRCCCSIAIYPGSFDPVTNGHLDIVERGLKLFDKVIVAILQNPKKQFLFPLEERLEMLKISMQDFPNVEADAFDGLLVDYAERRGAAAVLRGLRALSDFEFEFRMALANHRLAPEIEVVSLSTSEEHTFLSSSTVREIASLGGDVSSMVPPHVEECLRQRFHELGEGQQLVPTTSMRD